MTRLKKHKIFLLSIVLAFMISGNAYADGGSNGINYFTYFLNLIFFIIVFIGIVFLAMYSTKIIAKRSNYLGRGENLTILDSINLGGNIKIVTIKMYNKIYILSISNTTTTLVDKLDEEDIDINFDSCLDQNMNNNQHDFSEYIDYFKEKISRKK